MYVSHAPKRWARTGLRELRRWAALARPACRRRAAFALLWVFSAALALPAHTSSAAAVATAPRDASNLLQNGGFEDGQAPWTAYHSIVTLTAQAHSGAQALQAVPWAPGNGLYYAIDYAGDYPGGVLPKGIVAPLAGAYTGTAWVRGTAGRTLQLLVAEGTAGTVGSPDQISVVATGDWQQLTVVHNVATAGVNLDVWVGGVHYQQGDSFIVDDISLTAPGTAPLPTLMPTDTATPVREATATARPTATATNTARPTVTNTPQATATSTVLPATPPDTSPAPSASSPTPTATSVPAATATPPAPSDTPTATPVPATATSAPPTVPAHRAPKAGRSHAVALAVAITQRASSSYDLLTVHLRTKAQARLRITLRLLAGGVVKGRPAQPTKKRARVVVLRRIAWRGRADAQGKYSHALRIAYKTPLPTQVRLEIQAQAARGTARKVNVIAVLPRPGKHHTARLG